VALRMINISPTSTSPTKKIRQLRASRPDISITTVMSVRGLIARREYKAPTLVSRMGQATQGSEPHLTKRSQAPPIKGRSRTLRALSFLLDNTVHRIPTVIDKNQDYLLKELNDVMSQSSLEDSNPDPDLHPQPESSCSDTGALQGKSPKRML
jgi:hypothetical protein